MSQSNLTKSEAGWARFRERTNKGAIARRFPLEHRPAALIGAAVKAGKQPTPKLPDPPEGEVVERRGRKQRRVRIAN